MLNSKNPGAPGFVMQANDIPTLLRSKAGNL